MCVYVYDFILFFINIASTIYLYVYGSILFIIIAWTIFVFVYGFVIL